MGASPLPWRAGTGVYDDSIYSADDLWIADCVEGSPVDNAALIVRAVNCHDDLVAALRGLLAENKNFIVTGSWLAAVMNAEAALAKATGGGE